MKRLALALLVAAALANAATLHVLTIVTPDAITESGPYADYSFFFWLLPTLDAEVASAVITTFGFTDCVAPCVIAPPVYRDHAPPGGVLHPGVPEPATFATMLAGLCVVFVLAFGLRGRVRDD